MKTPKQLLAILLFWGTAAVGNSEAMAQTAMNSVYVELFGQNSFFTFNYDRMIGNRFGLRTGIGMSGLDGTDGIIVPITANYLLGDDHKFEFDAGLVYENGTWQRGTQDIHPILSVGYRYQPTAGGFMIRAAVDAVWYAERVIGAVTTYDNNPGLQPGISLSVGYAF